VIVALVALGLLIGLTLGALGAGGSILAVPVLVHVAGLPAGAATATSLVAVGSAAALAASGHRRNVRLDVALWFVPTGFVGALMGAIVGTHLHDDALLLAFSALMLAAAYRMFAVKPATPRSLSAAANDQLATGQRRANISLAQSDSRPTQQLGTRLLAVAAAGAAVGFLTGLFGVGGGFVIVPALTLAVGLAMPAAVATSLLIVAANALIALTVRGADTVDWPIALALTVPMLAGSLVGVRVGRRVDPESARVTFAALLVAVALLNAVVVVA
jgi:uncharacterized protein